MKLEKETNMNTPKENKIPNPYGALGGLEYLVENHVSDPYIKGRMEKHIKELNSYFFPEMYICHTCMKVKEDPIDIELIKAGHECTGCDHVRGEYIDNMLCGADAPLDPDVYDLESGERL